MAIWTRFPVWGILSASLSCHKATEHRAGRACDRLKKKKKNANQVFLALSAINQKQTDCFYNKFHDMPFLIQGLSEKGKGSGLTRTPETVLGWHLPTLAGQGEGGPLGWQLLIYFQGRKEIQRVTDVKTRDETVMDKSLSFAPSYFLRGQSPTKPGHGCQAAVLEP